MHLKCQKCIGDDVGDFAFLQKIKIISTYPTYYARI
jgi:hypothetical protein